MLIRKPPKFIDQWKNVDSNISSTESEVNVYMG